MQGVYNFLGYDISAQLKLSLYALILGAALGILFDFFRITRVFAAYREGVHQSQATWIISAFCFVEDILFAVISAVILVLFCFKANGGTSRGYILFGALVGFVLFLSTIGRLISRISKSIAKLFYSIIAFTKSRVIIPVAIRFKQIFYRIYKITLGRALDSILRRVHTLRMRKMSRELLRAISRLYINKGKDNEDETVSHANAGEARRVRRLYNIDSHPRNSADRIQSARRGAGGFTRGY